MRRGFRDEEAFITAHAILERGGCLAMYCEGGRSRSGRIGDRGPPGIGRLALESGATVVPVAIHGSARVRNWKRLQFPKVTVQYGEPFRYERVAEPTRDQQQAVADEILDAIKALYARPRRRGPRRRPPRAWRGGAAASGRHASGGVGRPSGRRPAQRRTSSQSALTTSVGVGEHDVGAVAAVDAVEAAADGLDAVVAGAARDRRRGRGRRRSGRCRPRR